MTKSAGISGRNLLAITTINAGTLSWYMYFGNSIGAEIVFQNFATDLSLVSMGEALFFLTAGISALFGILLRKRTSNKKFLWAWTFFGILCSAMTLFFSGDLFVFIFGPLLGIAMGLGFPYSLSLLASQIDLERRGRASGIMLLETFLLAVVAGIVNIGFNLGFTGTVVTLVLLKSVSLLGLAISQIKTSPEPTIQLQPVSRTLTRERNKNYLLYLIPWIMFVVAVVIIDHVIWPTLEQDPQIAKALGGIPYAYVGTTIFAGLAGIIADRFGRKIPIFAGLAVLGFSSALLGSMVTPETAFIHHMAIGVAFGFLFTAYCTIPGDLSDKSNAEKLYALILVVPFLIYFALGSLPQYFGASATAISVSWILTTLIFASLAPIYFARETLKEEKVRERQSKEYLEKLIKVVEESKK
jgi:MFS family permease